MNKFLSGRDPRESGISQDSAFVDIGDDEEDSARKLITELTQKDGNDRCADCGEISE